MHDKVALVTGGARGIGRGIAERFLLEGMKVVIADADAAQARKTAADLQAVGDASFVALDVSNEAQVRRAVGEVVRRHKRLDVLVNNAGLLDTSSGFDLKRWNKTLSVDLTGPFLCSKYAEPHLRRAKGTIINIASTRALMSEPQNHAYAASKGGLVALTHSLAISLAPDIHVHCVSPGWINSGNEKLRPVDHKQHPVGRVGIPADIAGLAFFLASPDAAFVTGQNYIIDGGMTRKMIYAE